jgi:IS605 OrfB family transposase
LTKQATDQTDVQTTEFKHTVSLTHELVLSDKSLGLTQQQKQSIESVLKAYTLAAKNIKNSTLFIIKNLQSSYQYVKEEGHYKIKSKLHKNQQELIDLANQAIVELNQEQVEKFDKYKKELEEKASKEAIENTNANDKDKQNKKEKTLKVYHSFANQISKETHLQTFSKTLIERIIRLKEQVNPVYKDYTQVHSHLAQGVLQKVCDDFNHHIKAMVAYQTKPKEFTGRPKTPGYMGKHEGASFEISALRLPGNGSFLSILKNHRLYHDFNKKVRVSQEDLVTYNSMDFKFLILKSIQTSRQTKHLYEMYGKDLSLASIKIMPCQIRENGVYKKSIKIGYVININQTLTGFFPDLQAKSTEMFKKDFFKLKQKQTYKLVKEYFNQDFVKNQENNGKNISVNEVTKSNATNDKNINLVPKMTMIDCGLTNFCTVSYFTGNSQQEVESNVHDVVSGKDLKLKMDKLARKIDKIKSEAATEEYKAIGIKRSDKQELTKVELAYEKKFYQDLYANPKLLKCYEKRKNLTLDYIHTLSKAIVTQTQEKGISLIVIGKNKGWKQDVNMGKDNNQWMHDFPHAQFIELLKYKALMKNILVISQEESYTSKTCFVNEMEMKTKEDKILNKEMKQEKANTTRVQQRAVSDTKANHDVSNKVNQSRSEAPQHNSRPQHHEFAGKRDGTTYTTTHTSRLKNKSNQTTDKIKVHADVHGSLNIGRKFIPSFNFSYLGNNMNIFKYQVKRLAKRGKKGLIHLKKDFSSARLAACIHTL